MKKPYLIVGSLACAIWLAQAQQEEGIRVKQSDISLVYNQYLQTGDNSAVTGGIGTERLTIYGPAFSMSHTFGNNIIDFDLGIDVISSASTDNIDFVESSPSRLDARTYTSLGYSRILEEGRMTVNGGMSASIESDYTSVGVNFGVVGSSEDRMNTYSAQAQMFFDDLRWGRLQGGFLKPPIGLIYPEELRFREWYDVSNRNSYNLNLGFSRIIDQRNTFGGFLTLSFQEGLLATPFHRVYFNDGSLAVELLPNERFKAALTGSWNTFLGGNIILRNSLHGYVDTFSIGSFAVESEAVFKLNARWNLQPSARFYLQSASKYFAPFEAHDPSDEFYTSDYDLSEFNSLNLGLRLSHSPTGRKNGNLANISWQYYYYGRSNNLAAHTLSMILNFKPKKDNP